MCLIKFVSVYSNYIFDNIQWRIWLDATAVHQWCLTLVIYSVRRLTVFISTGPHSPRRECSPPKRLIQSDDQNLRNCTNVRTILAMMAGITDNGVARLSRFSFHRSLLRIAIDRFNRSRSQLAKWLLLCGTSVDLYGCTRCWPQFNHHLLLFCHPIWSLWTNGDEVEKWSLVVVDWLIFNGSLGYRFAEEPTD